ncbi:hypothetical protein E2562_012377 [Oryza meyeriana var. granulata]|uniref:Uncharacterized protein n=1 Tax=Oryza meyeriana var. granulata TaxID=110450 RepID=A0A6G1C591_9ORYZ|nr:hypothetical protein E2562_012377 [Oryza meyeriana var. granulata]
MVVVALQLLVNRHARRVNGSAAIPGPRGWPLLGSLPAVSGPLMHRRLAALADAHGARRLMSLSLGATPVVVSSHPDTAREILAGAAFRDRPAKAAARELMFCRSEMIFRGADVVAILMEWAMARMVLHPDIQSKAQQELDTVDYKWLPAQPIKLGECLRLSMEMKKPLLCRAIRRSKTA